MAVQDTMNCTFGRTMDLGIASGQYFANLGSSPGGFIAFNAQNFLLDLHRKLVRIAIRAATAVAQTIEAYPLVPIPEFVPGFPRYAEFPAELGHLFAFQQASNKLQSFIHESTFLPRHTRTS